MLTFCRVTIDTSATKSTSFYRRFGEVVKLGWGGVRAPHWRGDWPCGGLVELFAGGADGPTHKTQFLSNVVVRAPSHRPQGGRYSPLVYDATIASSGYLQ